MKNNFLRFPSWITSVSFALFSNINKNYGEIHRELFRKTPWLRVFSEWGVSGSRNDKHDLKAAGYKACIGRVTLRLRPFNDYYNAIWGSPEIDVFCVFESPLFHSLFLSLYALFCIFYCLPSLYLLVLYMAIFSRENIHRKRILRLFYGILYNYYHSLCHYDRILSVKTIIITCL